MGEFRLIAVDSSATPFVIAPPGRDGGGCGCTAAVGRGRLRDRVRHWLCCDAYPGLSEGFPVVACVRKGQGHGGVFLFLTDFDVDHLG